MSWLIRFKDIVIAGLQLFSAFVIVPLLDSLYHVLRVVPKLVITVADILDRWASRWHELMEDDDLLDD